MKKTLLSAAAALFAMTTAASVHVTAEVYDDDTGKLYAGTNARVRVTYSHGSSELASETSSTLTVEVDESRMSGAYGTVYAKVNGCVADPDLDRSASRWEIADDSTGIGLAVIASGANAAAIALGWLESEVWGKGKASDVSAGGKVTIRLHVSHLRRKLTYAPGGDGVEGLPDGRDFPSGVPFALSSDRPTRTGFTFAHWASGGTSYLPAESVVFSQDTELTAAWTTNTYTIAFDANGGTGKMSALDCDYGRVYALPPVGFSRAGHVFDGWLRKETSRRYDDGVLVFNLSSTAGTRVTMSAVWSALGCAVTFDACGGSDAEGISRDYGSAYGALPTSERAGYVFDGWFTSADGGTKVNPEDKVTAVDGQTLYAHWTAKTCALTFDANGGTGTMSTGLSATYDEPMPGPVNLPTKEGHAFLGFYDATADGTQYYTATGTSARVWDKDTTERTTLFAQWHLNQYPLTLTKGEHIATLRYSLDGGNNWFETNATCSVDVDFGTNLKLYAVPAVGYQTAYNSSEKAFSATMGTTGVTFAPTTTAKTSALRFEANGGTGTMSTGLTATYGAAMPTPINLPTREGHTFVGFYDTTAGGTRYYAADGTSAAIWTNDTTAATTLYAQWSPNQYPLTLTKGEHIATLWYSLDGGNNWLETNATCSVDVDFGTNLKLYAVPTVGYQTAYNSSKEAFSATMGTTGVTFAPTTTAKTSALKFEANGGTGTMSTGLEATYGEAMPTPVNLPTWEGHGFLGFYDTTTGGTQYYTATGTSARNWNKDTTAATTLYAQWSVSDCTLTLTKNANIETLHYSLDDGSTWAETNASCTVNAAFGTKLQLYAVSATGYLTDYTESSPRSETMGTSGVTFSPTATAKTSALTFNVNGGEGEMSTGLEATYGEEMPTPVNLPSWAGNVFQGFYDAASGGTQYYAADGTSTRSWDKDTTEGTTLYAQWKDDVGELSEALDVDTLYFSCAAGDWVVTNDSSAVGGTCVTTTNKINIVNLRVEVPSDGTLTFNWKLLRPEDDFAISDEGFAGKFVDTSTGDKLWEMGKGYNNDWTAGSANVTNGVYQFTFDPGTNPSVDPFCLRLDNVSWTPTEP